MNIKQKQMKTIQLTPEQIDKIYFTLIDYIKRQNDVDRLYELSPDQEKEYKTELEIINEFVML